MDDKIFVAHPFCFPTQIVMVDDDLDGVSLMLDSNLLSLGRSRALADLESSKVAGSTTSAKSSVLVSA